MDNTFNQTHSTMKISLLTIIALLFSGIMFAQDIPQQDVPATILNTFKKAYPDVQKIDWEKKGEVYNAEFEIGRRDHEIWIDSEGSIIRHKEELRASELPESVSKAIMENHPGSRIDEVDKFTEGNQTYYKVELKNAGVENTIVVDHTGAPVDKIF